MEKTSEAKMILDLDGIEKRCERGIEVIHLLETDIPSLLQFAKEAKAALEFYGNKELWALSASLGNKRTKAILKSWGEGLNDLEEFKEFSRGAIGAEEDGYLIIAYGGKTAREVLTKYFGESE